MTRSVLCVLPEAGGGWAPVSTMAALAARTMGARLVFHHPQNRYSLLTRVLSLAPRRRGGEHELLVIAAHPGSLLSLAEPRMLLDRFSTISTWIIDDFWTERIPRFARKLRVFNHVFVTDRELVNFYADVMRCTTTWVPWGTDTLHQDLASGLVKSVDLLRLGRQPAAWDDDVINDQECAARGLSYAGRFPVEKSAEANQASVLRALGKAKVVLASAPSVSRASYTHPTRDYISARWCDAAAAGTLVLGKAPRCAAAELLPESGVVDVEVDSREPGLRALEDILLAWTPEHAGQLRSHARQHLDWRWRLRCIALTLNWDVPQLDSELEALTNWEADDHAG